MRPAVRDVRSPRLETLFEAVRRVLCEATGPLTPDENTALTEKRLERNQPKGGVSACLQSVGATHDPINRTRVPSMIKADQADEDDYAVETADAIGSEETE